MNKNEKFVVKHKTLESREDSTVTMTLRLDIELQQEYDELARKSERSRNELMNMALKYALDNLEFMDKKD